MIDFRLLRLSKLLTGVSMLFLLTSMTPDLGAQEASRAEYDESQVPEFELPDPLKLEDGTRVTDGETWFDVQRPRWLSLFQEEVYGRAPGAPEEVDFRVREGTEGLPRGASVRKQVEIILRHEGREQKLDLLLYLPEGTEQRSAPVFLGLNFYGNQSIHSDPEISVPETWMRENTNLGVVDHRASETSRGVRESRWPVEFILSEGYGLATMYYGDIDPDFDDGFENGVHSLFQDPESRRKDDWGSIAAWAWGLSRAMDYLETDRDVDSSRVTVIGHSRLGKTALWAGARDTRFAAVISNNSGCGGAALSRRRIGETVARINQSFPHWFCENFKKYNEAESDLPIDQHILIALIAPRPVYVASASEDLWADPKGEFLAARAASPVYELLTGEGLAAEEMPEENSPVLSRISYHLRRGPHDLTRWDWGAYLTFADRYVRGD